MSGGSTIPSSPGAAKRGAHDEASYIASLDCVHCGLCLQHCPTYLQTGRESASPRGRLYLMRALLEGRAEPSPDLVRDLDLCLVCRACETACPSGVRYGEILGSMRARTRKRSALRARMMGVLAKRGTLHRFASLLRFWQRSGLRALRVLLPARLRRMESYLPPIPAARERRPLPATTPARGTSRGRVALLEGCAMSVLFQDVNRDTIRLLTAAGFDVVVPAGQTCCGALHEHDGDLDGARTLLARNVEAFLAADPVAVVMNSAGCGAAFRGAGHLAGGAGAARLSALAVDVSRFLVEHGGALRFRASTDVVTYDAPCHLIHAQREAAAPLELISRVPGARFVPMEDAALCCGAAGIYNLDEPEMSRAVLEPKLDHLAKTGASILLSGNPGCLLQWRQGVRERGLAIEVLHPVTWLARFLD